MHGLHDSGNIIRAQARVEGQVDRFGVQLLTYGELRLGTVDRVQVQRVIAQGRIDPSVIQVLRKAVPPASADPHTIRKV